MRLWLLVLTLLAAPVWGVEHHFVRKHTADDRKMPNSGMGLVSWSFPNGTFMPKYHSCEHERNGSNHASSPPMAWGNLPKGTKTMVVIIDDPDWPDPRAPEQVKTHMILYNIPSWVKQFREGFPAVESPYIGGMLQGTNSWNELRYHPICPPIGVHRYYIRLYALDVVLPDLHHPNREQLEKAMEGHLLDRVEYMGLFRKQGIPW